MFKSYLLSLQQDPGTAKAVQHYKGCLRICKFLSEQSKQRKVSLMFEIFEPLIRDDVTQWLSTELLVQSAYAPQKRKSGCNWPTFERLVAHCTHLEMPELPAIDLAAGYTLWNHLSLLNSQVARIAQIQAQNRFDKGYALESILIAVKSQLNSPLLQRYLKKIGEICDEAHRRENLHDYTRETLITCYFMCIRILLHMLECGSILKAVESDYCLLLSLKVLSFFRAIESQGKVPWLCLLVGGVSIPKGRFPEGKVLQL